MITTMYADDTQSRAASRELKELERRNGTGITKVCNQLKALRLKVNEDKTVYMVLTTPGMRRRDGCVKSQTKVCGEVVKNVQQGKALGLIVSDDLSWRDNTAKVVRSCTAKLSGLWRCTGILREDERKRKAECIILPCIYYCLETTSTGLKSNMEKLQGVQSAAARWVLQTKRTDWSLRGGLKRLGWLSVVQQAAYLSVKLAIQILQKQAPERLYRAITEVQGGQRVRKELKEQDLRKLKLSTMKSWSVRSMRWMSMMGPDMLNMDTSTKHAKESLKSWIKHRVAARGDKVFWGKSFREEDGQRGQQDGGHGGDRGPGEQGGGERFNRDENEEREGDEQPRPQTQEGLNTSREHVSFSSQRRQVRLPAADHKTSERGGIEIHKRLKLLCPNIDEGKIRRNKLKHTSKRHRKKAWRDQQPKSRTHGQDGEETYKEKEELQGGQGGDLRSLPQALKGHGLIIMPCCAGPQNMTGKDKDDGEGCNEDAGDDDGPQGVHPNTLLYHVRECGTYKEKKYQQKKGEKTKMLERQLASLLILGRKPGCSASGRVRGGRGLVSGRQGEKERSFWLHIARAGVG